MSGIINKVKDALHHDNTSTSTSTSHTTTTHSGATGGSHSNTGTGYNQHGVPEGTAGPHSSRAANAADPRVDSDLDSTGNRHTGLDGTRGTHTVGHDTGYSNTTTHSTNAGPHGTLGNKLDPRVDSDRDGSGLGHNTHNTHTTGSSGYNSGVVGGTSEQHRETVGAHGAPGVGQTGYSHSSTTTGYNSGVPEGTAGPHSSRAANALDPRVDSDLDSNRQTGSHNTTGTGFGHSNTGSHNTTTGTGFGHSSTGTGYNSGVPEGTAGPHSSRTANALDPRVDSDLDSSNRHAGSHTTTGTGYGQSTGTGYNSGVGSSHNTTGTGYGQSTGAGYNSGVGGSHATAGSGTAQHTAGPHNNDLLNKLDPRVDSDRDGSKTTGGNKTFQSDSASSKDPLDAASVPPSVMKQHIGEPVILHDDKKHNHAGRHGSVSHQERHIGL